MTTWKPSADWKPNMKRPVADLEVRCLTNDAGHVWMHYFDPLPPAVRRRLAESRFNICPACMHLEACKLASQRNQPTVSTYFAVIEAIEQKLLEDILCR
jgi:hypothetical protein